MLAPGFETKEECLEYKQYLCFCCINVESNNDIGAHCQMGGGLLMYVLMFYVFVFSFHSMQV